MDRISKLPDHIIHEILFLLSTKEIVASSILSKTWLQAWLSFPVTDFDGILFREKKKSPFYRGKAERLKKYLLRFSDYFDAEECGDLQTEEDEVRNNHDFINFVDKCLSRNEEIIGRMDRFRLVMIQYMDEHSSRIDHWLETLLSAKCKLKVIDICILASNEINTSYCLPKNILPLVANSLTILRLRKCKIDMESLGNNNSFVCLQELSLTQVSIDDKTTQILISSCLSIKIFKLMFCVGVQNIELTRHPKLEKVEVCQLPVLDDQEKVIRRIKIKSPALHSFYYNGGKRWCDYKIDPIWCKNLKELNLLECLDVNEVSFQNWISEFPQLISLGLMDCEGLEKINISSERLERLRLFSLYALEEVQIDTPNLHLFDYRGRRILSFGSFNISSSHKARLSLEMSSTEIFSSNIWFLELKEFVGKFGPDVVLTLMIPAIFDATVEWNAEKVRDVASHPIILEHLEVEIRFFSSFSSNEEVLSQKHHTFFDGLLWNCYPKKLSIKFLHSSTYDKYCSSYSIIKGFYELLINNEVDVSNCCSSNNIRCWRHCLKHFQIARIIDGNIQEDDSNPIHSLPTTEVEWNNQQPLLINQEICFILEWFNI